MPPISGTQVTAPHPAFGSAILSNAALGVPGRPPLAPAAYATGLGTALGAARPGALTTALGTTAGPFASASHLGNLLGAQAGGLAGGGAVVGNMAGLLASLRQQQGTSPVDFTTAALQLCDAGLGHTSAVCAGQADTPELLKQYANTASAAEGGWCLAAALAAASADPQASAIADMCLARGRTFGTRAALALAVVSDRQLDMFAAEEALQRMQATGSNPDASVVPLIVSSLRRGGAAHGSPAGGAWGGGTAGGSWSGGAWGGGWASSGNDAGWAGGGGGGSKRNRSGDTGGKGKGGGKGSQHGPAP
jgi:hypothetical protein